MRESFNRTPRRTPALETHNARMRTTQPTIVVVRSPSVSSTAGLEADADDVNVNESERADVVSELRHETVVLRNDVGDDIRGNAVVAHARGDSACSTDGYVDDRRLGSRRRGRVNACDECDLELIIALGGTNRMRTRRLTTRAHPTSRLMTRRVDGDVETGIPVGEDDRSRSGRIRGYERAGSSSLKTRAWNALRRFAGGRVDASDETAMTLAEAIADDDAWYVRWRNGLGCAAVLALMVLAALPLSAWVAG